MYLLHTEQIKLYHFEVPPMEGYAILSHTWEQEEVTFQDMQTGSGLSKKGYGKVYNLCRLAAHDEYQWAWMDTCCIDESSSAELSEAINSMFTWYSMSCVCYVYLQDVDWYDKSKADHESRLGQSRWFTRGWTLQELLAPEYIQFLSGDWTVIGSWHQGVTDTHGMRVDIGNITGIALDALQGADMRLFSAAEKMSWAARRQTTRIEDIAYSLMGIFDINMPLLYGEGAKAFRRLQEHIIAQTEDYSIFAWQDLTAFAAGERLWRLGQRAPILARGPQDFGYLCNVSYRLERIPGSYLKPRTPGINEAEFPEPPIVTPRGIRMTLSLIEVPWDDTTRSETMPHALLSQLGRTRWLCIRLKRDPGPEPAFDRRGRTLVELEIDDLQAVSSQSIYVRNYSADIYFWENIKSQTRASTTPDTS